MKSVKNAKLIAALTTAWRSPAAAWIDDASGSSGPTRRPASARRLPAQSSAATAHGYGCPDARYEPHDDAVDGRFRRILGLATSVALCQRRPAATTLQTEAAGPRRYASSRSAKPNDEGCSRCSHDVQQHGYGRSFHASTR